MRLTSEGREPRRAALVAIKLADDFGSKGSMSVAQGWFGRAERLLADEPESAEHGHLAIGRAMTAMISGDIPQILEQAEIALEIGKRFDDRELQAYSLSSAVARSFSRVKSPRAWRFWTRRPLRPSPAS